MTCKDKLYASTDINIALSILRGFAISDIASITVTLTMDAIIKSFTGASIVIADPNITLKIDKTDITTPGWYNVKIRVTDQAGEILGITPQPEKLYFN